MKTKINPVQKFMHRYNKPKVEPDRTKYRRKTKHKPKDGLLEN